MKDKIYNPWIPGGVPEIPAMPALLRRLGAIFLILAGLSITTAFASRNALVANIILCGSILSALLLYYYPARFQEFYCGLLTITVLSAFAGPAFISIDIGFFSLFPFRIFLIIIWICFLVGLAISGKINFAGLTIKDYLLFLAIWFIYAVLSLGWAASKEAALVEIVFLGSAFSLVFFMTYFYRTRAGLNLLFNCLVGAVAVILVIALWENMTGNHLPLSAANYYLPRRIFIPTGVFRNPNDLAFFLTLAFPFLISLMRYRRGLPRLVGGLLGIISLYIIVITQSRASYLSMFLLMLLFFLLFLRFLDKIKASCLLILVLGMAIVLFSDVIQNAAAMVLHQMDLFWGGFSLERGSIFLRLNLILNGLVFLYRSWFLGVGAGNVEYYMQHYGPYDTGSILNMHNWWVEILVNYGIIIFAAYTVIIATLIYNLYVYWRRSGTEDRFILEPLILSLIGFVLASTSPSRIIGLNIVWIQLGFALSALNYYRQRVRKGEEAA